MKSSISKALGFGIVLGGSIVKVPQIVKIVRSGSARGLSLSSYLLDTAATGITVAYNVRHEYPWGSYGESVFLLIQNVSSRTRSALVTSARPITDLFPPPQVVIIILIILYGRTSSLSTLAITLLAVGAAAYTLFSPAVPLSTLKLLLSASIPLSLSSKLPQIISNFRLGSTGQLSAFLVFNSLAGCLARVYTTSTETGDNVLWWGFTLGAVLNGVIALQMLGSWNQEEVKAGKEKVEEVLEKVEVHPEQATRRAEEGVQEAALQGKKVAGSSPKVSRTSSPASAKRYVRKLE